MPHSGGSTPAFCCATDSPNLQSFGSLRPKHMDAIWLRTMVGSWSQVLRWTEQTSSPPDERISSAVRMHVSSPLLPSASKIRPVSSVQKIRYDSPQPSRHA